MKNIFKILSLFAVMLAFSSCERGEENKAYDGDATAYFLEKFAVAKGPATGFKDFEIKVGTMSPVDGATTIGISRISGNAVAGTDYQILDNGNTVIPAGGNSGVIKVRIFGAGLSKTVAKTLVFDLVSNSITKATFNNTISLSLLEGCDSFLAGSYAYSTVNYYSPDAPGVFPGPVTGTAILADLGDGLYGLNDASFGGYVVYGAGTIASGVKLQDACGVLTFQGANQYGDSFTISNVVVNGTKLTFKWTTTYGEYGTTTLTRGDGTNWPPLTD